MTRHTVDVRGRPSFIQEPYASLPIRSPKGQEIRVTNHLVEMNGKPFFVLSGEFHYFRMDPRFWETEIGKMKASGLNTVSTYVAWILHEEEEGAFDFSGPRDIRRFVELCAGAGMHFILRIGPFIHAEFRNGGMPDWLYGKPFRIRTNDEGYLFFVDRYFRALAQQLHGLIFAEGGPIIALQIENELMSSSAPWEVSTQERTWGAGGIDHLKELRRIIDGAGLSAPVYLYSATPGKYLPFGEALPAFGGYPYPSWIKPEFGMTTSRNYNFRNGNRTDGGQKSVSGLCPFVDMEQGTGIMVTRRVRPLVPPESASAHAAVELGNGCNFMNYYMYHGGSNPVPQGSHYFFNEYTNPKVSYDFQAPIGEYGQMREMNRELKILSLFLGDFGSALAPLCVALPEGQDKIEEGDTRSLRYSLRSDGRRGFLFINNFQDHARMQDQKDLRFTVVLDEETMAFPRGRGITVPSGRYAILPLNMEAAGVTIRYATAQPLARIELDGTVYLVMFAPEGNDTVEYGLDPRTVQAVTCEEPGAAEAGDSIYTVAAHGDNLLRVTGIGGGRLAIKTVTKREALQAWKVTVGGTQRLVFTDLDVVESGEPLKVTYRGSGLRSVDVFPPFEGRLLGAAKPSSGERKNGMSRFEPELGSPPVSGLEWERVGSNKAMVRVPPGILEGRRDVFLVIRYRGDAAHAFVGSRLAADQFSFDMPWEIGLSRLVPQACEHGIGIHIRPRYVEEHASDAAAAPSEAVIDEIGWYALEEATLRWDAG